MLDVMSMSQFLLMLGGILQSISGAGADVRLKWFRYLVTRYEPTDGPQAQMVGFMQALFPKQMLKNPMVKSTAISDAGITNQTLYEVERSQFTRATYDRALEAVSYTHLDVYKRQPLDLAQSGARAHRPIVAMLRERSAYPRRVASSLSSILARPMLRLNAALTPSRRAP